MEKIATAEEIYQKITSRPVFDKYNPNIKKAMIEFAKLHVEAALKEASEKAKMIDVGIDYSIIKWEVDKDSILNSYPLDKIK